MGHRGAQFSPESICVVWRNPELLRDGNKGTPDTFNELVRHSLSFLVSRRRVEGREMGFYNDTNLLKEGLHMQMKLLCGRTMLLEFGQDSTSSNHDGSNLALDIFERVLRFLRDNIRQQGRNIKVRYAIEDVVQRFF